MEEFSTHAAKGNILHDREARDLFTLLAGSTPNRPIPFISNRRSGTAHHIELAATQITSRNINFPQGTTCGLQFQHFNTNEALKILEIEFCNPADFPIDVIQISQGGGGFMGTTTVVEADKVEKIPGKQMFGFSIYRAIFKTPVTLKSRSEQIQFGFRTKTYSGPGTIAYIQGAPQQTFELKGRPISINIQQDQNQSVFGGSRFTTHQTASSSFGLNQDGGWHCLVRLKLKM